MAKAKSIVVDGIEYIPADSVKSVKGVSKDEMSYVIARTYSSGVFAGFLKERGEVKDGYMRVVLVEARRIWYWTGAASLSQLAQSGTSDATNCKFPEAVSKVELMNVIELLDCTEGAYQSIINVPVWKK